MGLLARLFGGSAPAAKPQRERIVRVVHAKYDAAQTSTDSYKHWANADDLSANSANSPAVRKTLRKRARYEVANNSYLKGIVLTLANDTIGTGPRLQLTGVDRTAAQAVEELFRDWCQDIGLAEKLRTMRVAKAVDGEAFALLVSAPGGDGVTLDLRLIEAEMIASPDLFATDSVDGIYLDAAGRPVRYHVLDQHPGETGVFTTAGRDVQAADMLHVYRADRPGQARGIPELTPCLELVAHLRRFTVATVLSAEAIANIAGVMETEAASEDERQEAEDEAFEPIEMERGAFMTLPAGYKMSQIKAETPSTIYAEFKHEVLNEIARCLNMPFNIAAGNSAGYNYSSGRLDHQMYYKAIRIEQDYTGRAIMDRVFAAWLHEARLVGILPAPVAEGATVHHQWFWDGTEHVDPRKEADAAEIRLRTLTTSLATEYARLGKDWEVEVGQIARERKTLKALGLTIGGVSEESAGEPRYDEEGDNSDDE